jgi:hypothetical protein
MLHLGATRALPICLQDHTARIHLLNILQVLRTCTSEWKEWESWSPCL